MGIWAAVKYALNSTVGTSAFQPLDKIISELWGGVTEYATPGTYVFKVPKNVHSIKVTACGGGGAGSAAKDYSSGGGGGSGGVAIQRIFTVKPLSTISITVGSGGAGTNTVVSSDAFAANGNATVVGTLVTLAGGRGGGVKSGGASAGEGSGAGGNGTDYESSTKIGANGSPGLFGKGGVAVSYAGGGGGSIGNGGDGASYGADGGNGTKGGGGGGGYKSGGSSAVSSKGGNGGDGYVKIEWGLAAL